MKYYLIAGEASGDLHGANLIKALKKEDAEAKFRFWGGDLMADAAQQPPIKHYKALAFMGFLEVLLNLRTIFKNISLAKKDIAEFQPDAIIYIDYPGFNMRIAAWAKKQGFKNLYYISPQLWAWKENRIKAIKRDIDQMYVILPFEKEFYEDKHQFPVEFVGHPLLDALQNRTPQSEQAFKEKYQLDDRPIIALLPGSRKQEIKTMLKIMLQVQSDLKDYQFVVAGAPSQEVDFYKAILKQNSVNVVMNKTYDLLSVSQAALVTSGTATLETALFKVPQVVCYKGNYLSYWIAKNVITLKYISLVNLILNRPALTELIQNELNKKNLKKALQTILSEPGRTRIFEDYYELEKKLGGAGASAKTASLIVKALKS